MCQFQKKQNFLFDKLSSLWSSVARCQNGIHTTTKKKCKILNFITQLKISNQIFFSSQKQKYLGNDMVWSLKLYLSRLL